MNISLATARLQWDHRWSLWQAGLKQRTIDCMRITIKRHWMLETIKIRCSWTSEKVFQNFISKCLTITSADDTKGEFAVKSWESKEIIQRKRVRLEIKHTSARQGTACRDGGNANIQQGQKPGRRHRVRANWRWADNDERAAAISGCRDITPQRNGGRQTRMRPWPGTSALPKLSNLSGSGMVNQGD